jgi:hypothetical protein
MFRPFLLVLLTACLLCATSKHTEALDISYSCKNCHGKPVKVLDASHDAVQDFDTCFTCHTDQTNGGRLASAIHDKHLGKMGVNEDTCLSCHIKDDGGRIGLKNHPVVISGKEDFPFYLNAMKTWMKPGNLVSAHKYNHHGCEACHTTYDFDEIDNIHLKCIACHGGYKTVAELTKTANETLNPHVSHYPKLRCTQCHVSHSEFHDYCNKCHKTGFKWTPKRK